MRTIQQIETFDGQTFHDERLAKRHLEKMQGELLCPLAQKLVRTGKYQDALNILEAEIETMRKLVQIHDDMSLEREESDN